MRRAVFSWKNPRMLRTVIAGCREKVMFEDLKPERSGTQKEVGCAIRKGDVGSTAKMHERRGMLKRKGKAVA